MSIVDTSNTYTLPEALTIARNSAAANGHNVGRLWVAERGTAYVYTCGDCGRNIVTRYDENGPYISNITRCEANKD